MSKITSIRRVANDGLQGEMTDVVVHPGRVNTLALLNKGDSRFTTGNPRRAWFPVTMTSLIELGISEEQVTAIDSLKLNEKFEVSIVDPNIDGQLLRIQVVESILPDAYQKDNVMTASKLIVITDKVAANKGISTHYDLTKYVGQKGYFLDADGNHIFSRASVTVEGQVKSVFVEGELVPEKELSSFGATLAEPVKASTGEFVGVE